MIAYKGGGITECPGHLIKSPSKANVALSVQTAAIWTSVPVGAMSVQAVRETSQPAAAS